MMISVFLYQSDPAAMEVLRQRLTAYFRGARRTFRVTASCLFEDSLRYLEKPSAPDDLYYFDFSDCEKGLQLAGRLRAAGSRPAWVCVSGDIRALLRALLLRPSAYLPDPLPEEPFLTTLKALERQHLRDSEQSYFLFKFQGEPVRLPYGSLSFLESNAKRVTLHLLGSARQYDFIAKLDDLAAALPDCFLRCHQSYIVNLSLVRRLDTAAHVFLLHSNEEIPISRRMYAEARERYEQYLKERKDTTVFPPRAADFFKI